MSFNEAYQGSDTYSCLVNSFVSELNPSNQFVDNESQQRYLDIIDLITHPALLVYEKLNPAIWEDVTRQNANLNDRVATYTAGLAEIDQHAEPSSSTVFETWLTSLGIPIWLQTSFFLIVGCILVFAVVRIFMKIQTGGLL